MDCYRGKLHGIHGGHLIGWVVNINDTDDEPTVEVLIDGRALAVGRADRDPGFMTQASIGARVRWFAIDLQKHLLFLQKPVEINVLIGPRRWAIPGAPIIYKLPPRGRIDSYRNGRISGWAIGESCSRACLEVLRGENVLFEWPCNLYRADLARMDIGDARFGFMIPIGRLCGKLEGLQFRIKGTTVSLEAAKNDFDDRYVYMLPEERFSSAQEARNEILSAIQEDSLPAESQSCKVRICFEILQNLLNQMSWAEGRLLNERRRGEAERPRERGSASETGACHAILAAFDQLSRQVETAPADALKRDVESELLARYRSDPTCRAVLEARIQTCRIPALLDVIVEVFRDAAYLSVPAIALAAKAAALPRSKRPNATELRQAESWARFMEFDGIQPRTAAPPRHSTHHRVLYVVWSCLPYDVNGYCARTHFLVRALGRIGEQVVVATRLGYPWDNAVRRAPDGMIERFENVAYVHLGGLEANRRHLPLDDYIKEFADRLAQLAALSGVDIIHSASNWMVGLPALNAARMLGLPFCYEIRGVWEQSRSANHPGYEKTDHFALFRTMEARVAKEADLVLAITPKVGADFVQRGVDRRRVRFAPNGVDTERFAPRPKDEALRQSFGIAADEFVFGYAGSFVPYEGLIDACEAARWLRERSVKFRLLLVGDGEAFADVAAFCRKHGLSRIVILTGRVPPSEVPRYYSIMDAVVLPRRPAAVTEIVSPLKPFEAMAMGKPVLGSDVAAVAAIISHGETGWLFPKGDVAALGRFMEEIVEQRCQLATMGSRCQNFVASAHDWKAVAGAVVAAWGELRQE